MSAFQYTAHCRNCFVTRAVTRAEVMTGKNPVCDGCGGAMVVYSGTGEHLAAPATRQRAEGGS